MTVWVLIGDEVDSQHIVGVYSTEEAANAAIAHERTKEWTRWVQYEARRYEVQ